MRGFFIKLMLGAAMVGVACSIASAAPTQDEVFKSINENVGSTTDFSKVIPWLAAAAGVVILLAIYSQRAQRAATPRKLNHRGKLLKEIAKGVHLKKVEIKQLKMLADEKDLSSPLTLLICPSILGKAMRTKNPRVDMKVLAQLAQRLNREEPKSV